jgi:hypothetical protein
MERRSRTTGQRLEVAFVDESGHSVALGDVDFVPRGTASGEFSAG